MVLMIQMRKRGNEICCYLVRLNTAALCFAHLLVFCVALRDLYINGSKKSDKMQKQPSHVCSSSLMSDPSTHFMGTVLSRNLGRKGQVYMVRYKEKARVSFR
jgi:hypothetical protein